MSYAVDVSSYRCRIHNGVRYYVGYSASLGGFACTKFIATGTEQLRFPSLDATISLIVTGSERTPGFDINADGVLYVDVPTDDIGTARTFYSKDGGETWTELS